ncbi:MFS transporter [Gluconacetobacter takamatsuzukensis]|uniref:MFS transporter n=1 Tax=Gluconacetobacter takamatsuzukensis TaxID=1286190 RepID=A0A7W4PTB3_9PROT|nr:MFS transporter [Gluconacetobacter takamatsuzukensis]MBB2205796.1 MFS transporter [Gluconacetobacter takamatsuzukensis]
MTLPRAAPRGLRTTADTQALSPALGVGLGAATAAAHIGNNFTTYLIGGLIDQFGFTPLQMGLWSMTELLAYAAAMLFVAPHVARLSPRRLVLAAGFLVAGAQFGSAMVGSFPPLLAGRAACGLGFGLANAALNLTAGRTASPARAISIGLAGQTMLYTLINLGLPMAGARYGTPGMFVTLGALTVLFTLAATTLLPGRSDAMPCPPTTPLTTAPLIAGWRGLGRDGLKVLLAMALFSFGSLALWPFIERAAHDIGLSAVRYGRDQSLATLACAASNTLFAALATRLPRRTTMVAALSVCGGSCAALTLVSNGTAFALALVVFNVSWLVAYPVILSIAYQVDRSGRLSVLCSSAWILNMALGALVTGAIAQWLGGYVLVGPLGLVICCGALPLLWPLTARPR